MTKVYTGASTPTPCFDQLAGAPVELEGPISVTEGTDVTHLRYRVRYPS